MQRPGVASTLVGVRTAAQLAGNIAAAAFQLSDEQMSRLNAASAPTPGFTLGLTAPAIRRMVFGGNDVSGWRE
jgi:diketogulonate reductase-like aldo/keto reductase